MKNKIKVKKDYDRCGRPEDKQAYMDTKNYAKRAVTIAKVEAVRGVYEELENVEGQEDLRNC